MSLTISKEPARVGVISDTHGLLRPAVEKLFDGVDLILHAGDIGGIDVLQRLERIAPVIAVLGNTDKPALLNSLSLSDTAQVKDSWIYLLHDIELFDIDPRAAGFSAVVYGHSHKSSIEWRNEVLFFNPGSAGPRRLRLPISVGILTISGNTIVPEIVPVPA